MSKILVRSLYPWGVTNTYKNDDGSIEFHYPIITGDDTCKIVVCNEQELIERVRVDWDPVSLDDINYKRRFIES